MEEEEIRREAEGAGPTSEDPRPESIGADAESRPLTGGQGAGDGTRNRSHNTEDSIALSQHTLSEGDVSAMRPLDPYESTLSQHPLQDTTASILDMSLAQYSIRDSTAGESMFSHRSFQQGNVGERLEPLGVEESKSDNGRGSGSQWVALTEDSESSPMKQPIEDLAQNLSVGAVELAILELSNEEEKDTVNQSVSQISHDLIEGILALSKHSDGSTEAESPAGPLSYHPLGESSISSYGLSIGRITTDGESSISQHPLEDSPALNLVGSSSNELSTGNITEEQSSLGQQWLEPKEDISICSNRLSTGQITADETTLSQHSLLESEASFSIGHHSSSVSHGSITNSQFSKHALEDTSKHSIKGQRPGGNTSGGLDTSVSGPSQNFGTKDSILNKLSPSVDQTMQFQPDMHSMNIGDSYLEKRPVSSSTPSSSKMLSQLSIRETSLEDEPSGIQFGKPKEAIQRRPREAPVIESEPNSEGSSGTELKEPVALIRKAGIDNYMTPEERARLVVASPPDANLSREEREEIFSDIFRAPPPGELTRSRSGSQRSLAGSDRSDKRSVVSEVENNRGHYSYGTTEGVSLIPPEDPHSRETSKRSAQPSINQSVPSIQDTQQERISDEGVRPTESVDESTGSSLINQLAINRVSDIIQSFECRSTTSNTMADRSPHKSSLSHSQRSESSKVCISTVTENSETRQEEVTTSTFSTTSNNVADRSSHKSSLSLSQGSESSKVRISTVTGNSEIRPQEVTTSTLSEINQKEEARSLEKERLAIGGFERPATCNTSQSPYPVGAQGKPVQSSGPASLSSTRSEEQRPLPPASTSSGHTSLPPFIQSTSSQRSVLEQLTVVTVPTGPSEQLMPTTVGGTIVRQESKTSTDSGDQDTSVWSQRSGDGDGGRPGSGLESGRLSSQSNASRGSLRSAGNQNMTGWDSTREESQDGKPASRPSSGHSYTRVFESNKQRENSEKSVGESQNIPTDKESEDDRLSVSSTLTDRVAALLAKPTHEGLTLVRPPSRDDSEVDDQRPSSRPHSSSSVETLKDNPLEGMDTLLLPAANREPRNLESPHSQFSDSSSTSYQDLPSSIHPSTVATKRRASTIAEASFEERSPSHSSTVVSEDMDPDVKQILKKYGEVLSEDDQKPEPTSRSQRLTPTGSVAESDDTNLTNRVNRLLQGPDLDKSYLYEDPARSITLGLASGSTTRTNTPPPTISELSAFSKSNESLNKVAQMSHSKSRESVCSQKNCSEPQQEQLKGEDTLSERVRHLLGEAGAGPGSTSSGRSSRTSSVNYDVLQNELEEIQRGLAILQKGELSLEQGDLASSVGTNSRRMSDASEGAASKVTESEVGTPRKFSWDYGDLKGEDMSGYRFVTSRSDLQTNIDHRETQRGQPEGVSGATQAGALPKSSSSYTRTEKTTNSSTEEGKYTRIARELEKETSPQRRLSQSKLPTESGPASWSGTTTQRYDFIGRSYDSLTRTALEAEVERVLRKKPSLDDSGQSSLSQKVHDLMERESPQRQAYKFLAEAEDSMRLMQSRRDSSRLHSSDTDLRNASPQNISSASSSFQLTPIPKRSFHAFGNVQSFLTTQLNKMSTAEFDTSVELRSPLKRQMEKHITTSGTSIGSEFRESERLSHLDLHRQEATYKTEGNSREKERSSRQTPTDRVHRRETVAVEVESSITDYTPGPRPVTMQDYVDGSYRGKLSERLKDRERGKQEEPHDRDDVLHARSTDRSSADVVNTPYNRPPGDGHGSERNNAHSENIVEDQLTPRSDSNGSVDSVVYPSAPQSARSDRSGCRSSGSTTGLRPYRPPGSHDLYYVESSTDDGNVSVANSETTVESTHIGSDDARAPSFPSHWLGSRSDPTQPSPSGIYSKNTPPEEQSLPKVLDPIVENKSFEDPKPHEVSSSEDKTLVEESFEGKNRSHHNNSGHHEHSDASTEQNSSADLSSDNQPHRGELRRAKNRDMRYLNEELGDGAKWAEKHHHQQSQDVYVRPRYDGTGLAAEGHTSKDYPDIPIARSERYKEHRDLRYVGDLTPDSRFSSNANRQYAFGTPQKHQADKSYDSTGSRSRYSERRPLRSPDFNALDVTNRSMQDSYRNYRDDRLDGSRSREQFDSTEDEITSRLQLYPGEEVHTMEETLDRTGERFTPLRPEAAEDAEVEALSAHHREGTSSSRTPASQSPSYHLKDHHSDQRVKSHYRSPPAMPAPTPPIASHRRPDSTSPTRRSARSTSPTSRSPSPSYKPVSADEYARWDDEHRSPPIEVTRKRAVDRPPMPPPPPPADRQAWSETGRENGVDSHRITREQQRYTTEPLRSKGKETDVNALWEKFQQRNTESSSDGEAGAREVDIRRLSSLLRNPVQHITQDMAASRSHVSGGSRMVDEDYRDKERISRASRRERDDSRRERDNISLQEEANRRSKPSSRTSPTRTPHRSSREASEPTSPSRGVTFNTEASNTASGPPSSDVSETRSWGPADQSSRSHQHHHQLREEATLQSIPEDTTLESVSTTDVTSSDSNGTRSLLQYLPDDPKLLKLQTKILRQRQKHEMEKLREQRRLQKIQKLERLLATKQTDGISEDGEEETATGDNTSQYVYSRSEGRVSGKHSQHTTDHSTTSPVSRPVSSSSGKSTSTPSSVKGSTGGTDMSFAVSDITSTSTVTQAVLRSDESSSTLVEDLSPRGTTTTATTTTQDETTPQQSEAEGLNVCACCNKKKGKTSRSKSPTRSSARSKSYKKVSSRSKSPSKVAVKSRSPVRVSSRSKSPTKVSRSQSPAKHAKPRSPSPASKRPHGRSASPSMSKKSRKEQDYDTYREVREKPLKEKHNKNSSYLEFDKPSRERSSRRESDRDRHEERERRQDWGRTEKRTTESQKQSRHKKSSDDKRSKENQERPREKHSKRQKSTCTSQYREERRPAPMEVDQVSEGSSGYEDFDNDRSVHRRTIGINVPTPISLSPPTRRKVRDVTMVSEGVQTTPHLHRYQQEDGDGSRRVGQRDAPTSCRRPPGAFTPETASPNSSTENVKPSSRGDQGKTRARASQAGLAWYIPIRDPQPWRRPLKERQAHAISMDTWPPRGNESWRAGYDLGSTLDQSRVTTSDAEIYLSRAARLKEEGNKLQPKISLQEALEMRRQDFISQSRERMKHLMLKSEERQIQDLHARQRAELFRIDRKLDPNKNAHPYSENLFKPKKRVMTKKEMKELTNKKYANLEEVKQKEEDTKRVEEYRTNRIRAQVYKQKILSKVLHKKGAWVN